MRLNRNLGGSAIQPGFAKREKKNKHLDLSNIAKDSELDKTYDNVNQSMDIHNVDSEEDIEYKFRFNIF